MIFGNLDRRSAGWVLLALRDLEQRGRVLGQRPPSGIAELAQVLSVMVSGGQECSKLAEVADLGDAQPVLAKVVLTVDEAADALSVSVSSVRRLIRSQALPAVKIAGALRVRISDLDEFVKDLPTQTGDAA